MYATEVIKRKILELRRGYSFSSYANLYLALFKSCPGSSGNEGYEVTYEGYARKKIVFDYLYENSTSITVSNTSEIAFTKCNQNAGIISYIGITDNLTGGNVLFYEELDDALNLQSDGTPTFSAGSVKIKLSGNLSAYYRKAIVNALIGKGAAVPGFSSQKPYIGFCYRNTNDVMVEFSGSPYARQLCYVSAPIVQSNGSLLSQNYQVVTVNFPTAKNQTLTDVCFYDAASGGNMYCNIPLKESDINILNTQNAVSFPVASLRFFVD